MDVSRILPREIGLPLPAGPPLDAPGAAGIPAPRASAGTPGKAPFQELLTQAVDTANQLSQKSDALSQALVQGRNVDLHRVVLAQQEAQIAFDLVLQMRDKLVSAYQEILRMPM